MFSNLLLLLFCFINYSGTPQAGTKLTHVTGKRGSDVTLPCDFEAREISHYHLSSWSKMIYVCQNEECESENDRVFKTGTCDVIIKDLIFSDAGKYILRLYYKNAQSVLERLTLEYYLHIHDEISAKTGEELKLDVLLTNTNKVVHQNNISTEWSEVWKRRGRVRSDRLTDTDGILTIKAFTANDAGTYRVLDFKREILITVTVTESGTQSKEKPDTEEDKTGDTEQYTLKQRILSAGMILFVVLLGLTLITLVINNHQFQQESGTLFLPM